MAPPPVTTTKPNKPSGPTTPPRRIPSSTKSATASTPITPTSSLKSPRTPVKSPRKPAFVSQKQQKEAFLKHLRKWSDTRDSNCSFRGTITPLHPARGASWDLGQAIVCAFEGKRVVVRLFGPEDSGPVMPEVSSVTGKDRLDDESAGGGEKEETLDPLCDNSPSRHRIVKPGASKVIYGKAASEVKGKPSASSPHTPTKPPVKGSPPRTLGNGPINHTRTQRRTYHLTIRAGSGWQSEKTFFLDLYLRSLRDQPSNRPYFLSPCIRAHSTAIPIRPYFKPFLHLPLELQSAILLHAAEIPSPHHITPHHPREKRAFPPRSSLLDLLLISKALNAWLLPWLYTTTTFILRDRHLTLFLLTIGPTNRALLRKLTFRYGFISLLHCARWLIPDAVFAVLGTAEILKPEQHYWRLLVRDLKREVRIAVLTIDVADMRDAEVPLVVKCLSTSFAGVSRLRFMRTRGSRWRTGRVGAKTHAGEVMGARTLGAEEVGWGVTDRQLSWREVVRRMWEVQRESVGQRGWMFGKEVLEGGLPVLEERMGRDEGFFGE